MTCPHKRESDERQYCNWIESFVNTPKTAACCDDFGKCPYGAQRYKNNPSSRQSQPGQSAFETQSQSTGFQSSGTSQKQAPGSGATPPPFGKKHVSASWEEAIREKTEEFQKERDLQEGFRKGQSWLNTLTSDQKAVVYILITVLGLLFFSFVWRHKVLILIAAAILAAIWYENSGKNSRNSRD